MAAPTPAGSVVLGFLGALTVVKIVNATPGHYTPVGPETTFVLLADTDCHISTTGGDATTNDFLLLAGVYATVNIDRFTPQSISWVVAAAAADGTLRITPINPKV